MEPGRTANELLYGELAVAKYRAGASMTSARET